MTITYRTPAQADIPAMAQLGAETFMATFGHLYKKADADAFLAAVHSIEGISHSMAMPGTAYLLAEESSDLVGFCKIGHLDLPVEPQGIAQELYQLYVREPYKGTGVAQHLMQWALNTFRTRQVDEVYLSVWSENLRAQRFYQRYGFEKVGEWDFMVGTQADHDFIYRVKLAS